jgi:hypothetical protein
MPLADYQSGSADASAARGAALQRRLLSLARPPSCCRADKGIAALEELLAGYPLLDPQVRAGWLAMLRQAGARSFGAGSRRGSGACALPGARQLPRPARAHGPAAQPARHPLCRRPLPLPIRRPRNAQQHSPQPEALPLPPALDPGLLQDERLHDMLESLRGKFKAVVTTLGKLGGYLPKEQGQGSLSY